MIFIVVGLALIIAGWSEQLYRVFVRRHRSFSPFFLALYIVGTAAIVNGNFQENDIVTGILNVVAGLVAFIILINILIKRRNPEVF